MMSVLFILIVVLAGPPQAAIQTSRQATIPAADLNALIDKVDRTFASMKDFSAEFFQSSTNVVNKRREDKGLLYLAKDRKMRWQYEQPEEKLFVSNGKTLYTYIPAIRQATRDQVNDSMANQIPLMFLVGRAGLRKEFKQIGGLTTKPLFEGDRVLRLTPNRKNLDIESIDIEVNPRTYYIERMIILNTDKSSNEFIFRNIEINQNIPASRFEFTPPSGIRIVQGSSQ